MWTSISYTDFETILTGRLFQTLGRAESGLELAACQDDKIWARNDNQNFQSYKTVLEIIHGYISRDSK